MEGLNKNIDKFEKLEKARFYLEQEGIELDGLVSNINKGKDEIEDLLRNEKKILNRAGPSGTKQILLALLKQLKPNVYGDNEGL